MSASKQKGTRFETAIVTFLRPFFPWADRVPLSGSRDRGDVTLGPGGPVIESKNRNRLDLAEAVDEANEEARNAGAPFGVAWIKRRGKASAGDGYVIMDGHAFAQLARDAGYGASERAR